MIVYNTKLLTNIAMVKKAKQWFSLNLISAPQMAAVLKKYPVEYFKPNVFIKIGLFIFTFFIIGAAMSVISLFTFMVFSQLESFEGYGIFMSILFGGVAGFLLEKFIKWRNWYSNGIDDALLYATLGSVLSVLIFIISLTNLNDEDSFLLICYIMLPILALAIMRYVDRIVTIVFAVCAYIVVFLTVMKLGTIAKFIMPFVFMAVSLAAYFLVKKQKTKASAFHYRKCIDVLKVITLIVFYLSGNYYVIRESSVEFFNLDLSLDGDIPMAFVFYAFTAIVPIVYLIFALRNKDKLLLLVSLLLIAIAALTFKYYFSLGHPEVTLTLAGMVMVCVAYISIRSLKTDKKGITFKDDPNEDTFFRSNAEALIIAQSFSSPAQTTNGNGVEMGGGDFGGAGSGGKY